MRRVITYGTYDMLHRGHVRLLERAKALGDYLIVGVTAEDYDKSRGKINVQQSLMERIDAVRMTGLADEIIIEEYEGQKIDDIKRYNIDVFTVGDDWKGQFDYLSEYCEVVYLERTQGISSSEIRDHNQSITLGLVGESSYLCKVADECQYVNGIHIGAIFADKLQHIPETLHSIPINTDNYDQFLSAVDAVYIRSYPTRHYEHIRRALMMGKHVLCESPIAVSKSECAELYRIAEQNNCILMEAIKTAYNMAFSRLVLLAKSGKIGNIISIDATCTSLQKVTGEMISDMTVWNSICDWGPTAMLPIFSIFGVNYRKKYIKTHLLKNDLPFDDFTKIDFAYDTGVASLKVGIGVKSEGELVISGTKGYIYVPAPWWKTDYFEIRYENPANNKRYFYQLDGEGIRYEFVQFVRAIHKGNSFLCVNKSVSEKIASVIEDFYKGIDVATISY